MTTGSVLAGIAGVVVISLLSAIVVYVYGRLAYRAPGAPSSALPLAEDATALDRALAPLTTDRPGQSGLLLSSDNLHAFAARAATARAAGRSLDLQYYYWKTDLTGMLLAREVVAAADRGVRVRLLLDDINLRGRDEVYLSLARHPGIEVRVFNPSWNRVGPLQRGFELIFRVYTSTRRMHNKAWIADGRLAIVGGRNVGDAYFDASDTINFRDLDLLAVGTAVQQAETIFDRFWNSDCVVPIGSLPGWETGDLERLRDRIRTAAGSKAARPYIERLEQDEKVQSMLSGSGRLHWPKQTEIVSDPPRKAKGDERHRWLHNAIFPLLLSARSCLEITSPYFIPGKRGVRQLTELARTGAKIEVLTNSLAATDVAAVHGAYARYRKELLRQGISLFELKPDAGRKRISLFGSSGASLHTKAFTVDDRAGFVGSFNFDPRSVSLNTEMGVVFHDAALAQEISAIFDEQIEPDSSYRLDLEAAKPVWFDGDGGEATLLRHEPRASLRRRLVATLAGWLPLESQL